MRKFLIAVVLAGLVSLGSGNYSYASEIDALLEKLVEKGILSASEAQQIRTETNEAIAKQEKQKKEDYKKLAKENLPGWVKNMKLKGDLRTRYQWEKKKGSEERHRERIRFRVGLETKVNDEVKVAAGLATGGTDPRSTNQTLEKTFDTPDIRLDYAYAQYSPVEWLVLKGGKIKKMPFWVPSDLLWDGDINPEGASLGLNYEALPNLSLFFNSGVFVLDESSSDTSDPYMYGLQPGFDFELSKGVNLKSAFTYYDFGNVKGSSLDHNSGTNTTSGGKLVYDYDALVGSFELGFKELLGPLPYFALLGEYVHNPDPSKDNTGFLLGCKLGAKKIKGPKQWQAKYLYRRLETDAFPDAFPDSDFYGGKTNAKGHEVIFQYGLFKNVTLGLDYYYSEPIKGTKNKEHLLQTDVVFKF